MVSKIIGPPTKAQAAKQARTAKKRQNRRNNRNMRSVSSAGMLQHTPKGHAAVNKLMRYAGSSRARELVLGMAEPAKHAQRLPTQYPCQTALVRNLIQFTLTAQPYQPPGFNMGDLLFAHIGQPALQLMVWRQQPSRTFTGIFPAGYSVGTPVPSVRYDLFGSQALAVKIDVEYPIAIDLNPVGLSDSNNTVASRAVGIARERNYVFLNTIDELKVTVTADVASAAAGRLEYQIFRWDETEQMAYMSSVAWAPATVGGFDVATISWTPASRTLPAGWYRVHLKNFNCLTAAGTITSVAAKLQIVTTSDPSWDLVCSPDLLLQKGGDPNIGTSCRTVGSSLLITNTSAMVNRQGSVVAARIVGDAGFDQLTSAYLESLSYKYTGDASLGVYTFKEIVEFNDEFKQASDPLGGVLSLPLVRPGDYMHLIQITSPGGVTMANTYTISVGYGIEFKTSIPRYQVGFSGYSLDEAMIARHIIAGVPEWFYENPQHMAALYRLAQMAYKGFKTVAPYATKAGRLLAPQYAPIYNAIDYLARP